ncbi:ATP-dependent DNA helicase DDX11 [Episyrphus balteatus]|uniref:ATP-dependent DNA helicase DDX11 n=1 Tax=Episyrphus balteatus TaxID=286459 RepID=UPI002486A837|nr:ATP-dependent DNA helicase DDX11 [Episyrphus balteatus]XP_055853975.1 ATP-dependent DNA helicase DDX11 [Episyrphus balteatus]
MYSPKKNLPTPQNYAFPYQPYQIQQNLMESLYEILENKQIGIFESPTGTGKSLTLTCGALRWLLDHEALVKEELQQQINELTNEIKKLELEDNHATDWIESHFQTEKKKEQMVSLRKTFDIIKEFEKKIEDLKAKKSTEKKSGVKITKPPEEVLFEIDKPLENDLELDEFDVNEQKDDEEDNLHRDVKIFFCSRTHSQLSQIVSEIRKTEYGKQVRCVSLASRQNLCIHPEVKKLTSGALINERCLDMQRSQSKKTCSDSDGQCLKKSRVKLSSHSKCPYKSQSHIENLRDSSLVDVLDIEDLVTAGKSLKSCPYYASRSSARDAQIIMLPYQLLLHKRTRLQTGICLKNSVVIIDEAHNLLDTISNIYSSEVSLFQLSAALGQMTAYKMKYCSRFSTQNLLKINQMIFITKRLTKMFTSSGKESHRMLRTHELMDEGEFFNINLYHILDFCEQTRFAQKLQGFAKRMNAEPAPSENIEPPRSGTIELLKKLEEEKLSKKIKSSKKGVDVVVEEVKVEVRNEAVPLVIRPLLGFLESLTECSDDGGVLITQNSDTKQATMKFILLNPGGHFEEIIKEARSIIIAGGTMRPTDELTDQLFKSCPERVHLKFYDHVVSEDAVAPFVIQKGPTGKRFLFNFAERRKPGLLSELGMTLRNVCNVIPAGIVCFFSSYDYMDLVYEHFVKEKFIEQISQKKHIFREPRGTGGQSVEKLLSDYACAIKNPDRNGALLFSVVGGKLSEGLNFADDLGRCVIVVGMPYPNKNSPELQEKMKYLDVTLKNGAGAEYYENLCMKSVNQCIGRSVRHINDYASVLLIDERYASEKVRKKLPQWISRNLKIPAAFGVVQGATAKFFRQKRIS